MTSKSETRKLAHKYVKEREVRMKIPLNKQANIPRSDTRTRLAGVVKSHSGDKDFTRQIRKIVVPVTPDQARSRERRKAAAAKRKGNV